jgi:ribokinase
VIVVGAINTDFIVTSAQLAQPGHTIAGTSLSISHGGKGANQAHTAALLGADVTVIGAVGDDTFGSAEIAALRETGIDVSKIARLPGQRTGAAIIHVTDDGENSITIVPGANGEITPTDIEPALRPYISDDAVLVLGFEVPLEVVRRAAEIGHSAGWTILLNPAPAIRTPDDLWALIDVVIPNEHELEAIGPAERILQLGAGSVIATRGAAGSTIYRPGEPTLRIPAFHVVPVDTTGAGDAYIGAVAWALARNEEMAEAVRYASAAGAIATLERGARPTMLHRDGLDLFIARTSAPQSANPRDQVIS